MTSLVAFLMASHILLLYRLSGYLLHFKLEYQHGVYIFWRFLYFAHFLAYKVSKQFLIFGKNRKFWDKMDQKRIKFPQKVSKISEKFGTS